MEFRERHFKEWVMEIDREKIRDLVKRQVYEGRAKRIGNELENLLIGPVPPWFAIYIPDIQDLYSWNVEILGVIIIILFRIQI